MIHRAIALSTPIGPVVEATLDSPIDSYSAAYAESVRRYNDYVRRHGHDLADLPNYCDLSRAVKAWWRT